MLGNVKWLATKTIIVPAAGRSSAGNASLRAGIAPLRAGFQFTVHNQKTPV